MMIPWKLIAILVSWLVVAVAVYEHEQSEFDKERAIAQAALEAANQKAKEISNDRDQRIASISSDLASTQAKADQAAKTLRNILPLVLCGCQSQLPVVAQCPTIPPFPAGIQKQEPTLTQELVKLLSPSQKEATKQSTN